MATKKAVKKSVKKAFDERRRGDGTSGGGFGSTSGGGFGVSKKAFKKAAKKK